MHSILLSAPGNLPQIVYTTTFRDYPFSKYFFSRYFLKKTNPILIRKKIMIRFTGINSQITFPNTAINETLAIQTILYKSSHIFLYCSTPVQTRNALPRIPAAIISIEKTPLNSISPAVLLIYSSCSSHAIYSLHQFIGIIMSFNTSLWNAPFWRIQKKMIVRYPQSQKNCFAFISSISNFASLLALCISTSARFFSLSAWYSA